MRVENKMSEAKWVYGNIKYENLIGEVVHKELNQGYHHFYLPIEYSDVNEDGYGGVPVEDPLTIRFGTDAFSDINGLLFEGSLTDIIDEMIDDNVLLRDGQMCIAKSDAEKFKRLAQGLQNEVNKLNKLIDNAVEE
jgi:hypothetical protein